MKLLENFSIEPNDTHIYDLAFLHESYSNEQNIDECYERLEFLGDAVLDLVVSEFLYKINPDLNEGELTRMRANFVCKQALHAYSLEWGLDEYIKLGVGAELTRREVDSVVADVFESFIGALYLDQGMVVVKDFLSKTVLPHIENGEIFFHDYKSELNQLCDQEDLVLSYVLVQEEGEPHNKKFTMAAMINGENYGNGISGSKKEAQQKSAKVALNKLKRTD